MGRQVHILLVEDEEDDAILLIHHLRQGGLEPVWKRVRTAKQLRSAFDEDNWDIIISDYTLPGFGGLEALEIVQELDRDIPFIMVSGQLGEETAVQVMKAGAHDYVLKEKLYRLVPVVERELEEATIRSAHRKSERLLEAKEQLLRSVISNGPILVCVTDSEGNITLAEGRGLETTFVSERPVTGLNVFEHFKQLSQIIRNVRRALNGEQFVEDVKTAGGRILETCFMPLTQDNDVIGSIGIGTDVTERKQAEEALRKANIELEEKVEKRTRDLRSINESLRNEIAERKKIEAAREKYLNQINSLVQTSMLVLAEESVNGLLQEVVEAARELTEADLGTAGFGYNDGNFEWSATSRQEENTAPLSGAGYCISYSEKYMSLIGRLGSFRLTDNDLKSDPTWGGFPDGHVALNGLMACGLRGQQGEANGLIIVSNKQDGDFNAEDEGILLQLAAITSLALRRIEALQEAECRALESEEGRRILEAMLRSVPEGILIADSELKIQAMSEYARTLSSLGENLNREIDLAEYFKSLNIRAIEQSKVPDANALLITQAIRKGNALTDQEFFITNRYGQTMYVLCNTSIIKDRRGDTVGSVVAWRDITQRRSSEEKLRWTAKELARSNEDLEQFARAVSHDLKEPLHVIKGFLDIFQRRYRDKLNEEGNRLILHAVQGTVQMEILIKDILDYARMGDFSKELTEVDTERVVRLAISNLQLHIEESEAVVTYDNLPVVRMNASQLGQLFQNLIANAVKFRRQDPPKVYIKAERQNEAWLFAVRDNGIGIEPRNVKRIFSLFQRLHTRNEYEGTGIGLAICKKIVERRGGKVWVESEPGTGSTFYFTIPD